MSAATFRWLLGGWLVVHLLALVPWAGELWSSGGMIAEASASPLALPGNLLAVADDPGAVTAFFALEVMAALAFTLGWHDRIAAVLLWYGIACGIGRNPLTANPALPYVGWMLLAHAAAPADGPRRDAVRRAGFWLLALGYTYSGAAKLSSPSWIDGSALARILENPLARDTPVRDMLLATPEPLLVAATWGALALELAFAPLALSGRLRPLVWAAMLLLHGGLLMLLDFADLTLGMMLVHAFTLERRWIPLRLRRLASRSPVAEVRRLYSEGIALP